MDKNGFIKLHRQLLDHPIWQTSTPEQKVILITLICMANHEPNRWEWGGEIFHVDRGQMVTSLDSIKTLCGKGISTQNIRTALVRFEKLGFLTNKSTKQGRLITIEKYSKWQDGETQTNKGTNKDLTKTSQRPNKDLTPNKNDKNDKNDKKYIYSDVPENIREPFMEWVAMRKKRNRPIDSKSAVTRALNKLNSLSKNPERQKELIEYAIYKNWLSFYPIPQEDIIPKPKVVEKEKPINSVPMPEGTREKMAALGFGNLIGKEK